MLMTPDPTIKPKIPRAHLRLMRWWNQLINVPDGHGGFTRKYRFGFPLTIYDHPVINYPVFNKISGWYRKVWNWIKSLFKRKKQS